MGRGNFKGCQREPERPPPRLECWLRPPALNLIAYQIGLRSASRRALGRGPDVWMDKRESLVRQGGKPVSFSRKPGDPRLQREPCKQGIGTMREGLHRRRHHSPTIRPIVAVLAVGRSEAPVAGLGSRPWPYGWTAEKSPVVRRVPALWNRLSLGRIGIRPELRAG